MEFNILYWIQGLRSEFLDMAMSTVFDKIVGSIGQIWIVVGVILLIFKKTRRTGICVLAAYGLSFLLGDTVLKHLVARPRPCALDETVALIVKRPTSFSFPSVHTAFAFSAATVIAHSHKKAAVWVFLAAALIGFSRMYFFVHFPSDVLAGLVLGVLIGIAVNAVADALVRRIRAKAQ